VKSIISIYDEKAEKVAGERKGKIGIEKYELWTRFQKKQLTGQYSP
jgi:hypothetical protein